MFWNLKLTRIQRNYLTNTREGEGKKSGANSGVEIKQRIFFHKTLYKIQVTKIGNREVLCSHMIQRNKARRRERASETLVKEDIVTI